MDDIGVDGTVYEVVDATARGIIGDGQLDPGFTATNLTGAANELKSNLTDLSAIDSATTPSVMSVNDTFQIPAYILAHHIIIVSARRQGLGNSACFNLGDLEGYDNGFYLAASSTSGYRLKCSSSGVLTLIEIVGGANNPNLIITGIL
jgi:hypothetical protein